MAYGNWGAFVNSNGERRKDKEDVGVFDTDESICPTGMRIWANLIKNNQKFPNGDTPWYLHSHHAVLGDNEVRLCGYKGGAELWVWRDGKPERIELEMDEELLVRGEVILNEKTWKYSYLTGEDIIHLELQEPDGTNWKATCGFEYGAGHME